MKKKIIVVTFVLLLTYLAIGFYMDCVVNPILLASYGGEISTKDIYEIIFLVIFLLCLPAILLITGFKIKRLKKLVLVWGITVLVYFFVPVTNFIQGYNGVIKIKQTETDLPIILKCNSTFNRIYSIRFPIALEVSNKAITRRKIDVVDYYYNNGEKTSGISRGWDDFNDLYIVGRDSLTKIPFRWEANRYKTLKGFQTVDMIVYTTHKPEISDTIQKILRPYLYTMMEQDVATLEIGSMKQIKEENPQLLNLLLAGDEITVINWGIRRRHLSNILKVEY
ncbi:hypothetical protein [Bacteroides sp. 519]|uniref:hypothetical protein n=1 Tax=Bacteroides sp. 519 TaxID=2302937 RepID=UPI0013D7B541|nr:hypothetical protein [Bacteroides sp. 519]NDV59759.1 hypothetical protein [Bacteroides sp. 519]